MACNHPRPSGRILIALLALACATGNALAGDGVPRDEQKNRWFHWEPSPTTPIACSADGLRVYVANQPGARIAVYAVASQAKLREIPVGPGVVALAQRPGSAELWAVDAVSSVVSVIDMTTDVLTRTIAVGAGASGLAFTPDGERAYVACSSAERVDVLRSADYTLVQSIAIPASLPHGIVCTGTRVHVVAFRSGNGSAPRGNPATGWTQDVTEVRRVSEFAGASQLPDQDLFTILVGSSPGSDVLDLSQTVRGLGTNLYGVHARPQSDELWVPGTDAQNWKFVGEKNFPSGRMVANQIAIVRGTQASLLSLDALTIGPSRRSGTPASVAFTADGTRAFVAGYGSDTVTVLRLTGQGASATLEGILRVLPAHAYPDGAGPRALVVTPGDRSLVVLNKGDNSISWLKLNALPDTPGYDLALDESEELGWDPLPLNVKQGRIHFRRTQNSLSGTSSCDSCHVDGGSDGLAWDLSAFLDPEGTARSKLALPLDRKGPMVTQSVRSLREVGPYHWRGERKNLLEFNVVFTDMLERHVNGELADLGGKMIYIAQYMEALALPPNPKQAADRLYTTEQLAGAQLFQNEIVREGLSCASCHVLPLATGSELAPNHLGGFSAVTKVPSLRGLGEKLEPPYTIGEQFGVRTRLGAGLNHAGNAPTIEDVALARMPPPSSEAVFDLDANQAHSIATFLEALDTGLAPAAVRQVTARPENAAGFLTGELAYLREQAAAGNCELVFRYGPVVWRGRTIFPSGLYDPATDSFRQSSKSLPPLSPAELVALAAAGTPVTFYGVPPWCGQPWGVDRDNDHLQDLDELLVGTSWEDEDSDDDGFPDGYEVQWGMNPLVPNASSPDHEAPTLVGTPRVVWTTTRSAKIEFETSELVRALFSYDGGFPLLRWPLLPSFDDHFSVVMNELEPGRETQITIRLTDPAGNFQNVSIPVRTLDRVLVQPIGIAALSGEVVPDGHGGDDLRISLTLRQGSQPPTPGYNVRAALYHDSPSQGSQLVQSLQSWLVRADGVVQWRIDVPPSIPHGGEFVLAVMGIDPPPGRPPHARGEDAIQRLRIPY